MRIRLPYILLTALCCLLAVPTAHAQDVHFSQEGENPILINPAYTGFYEGTGRFGLLYRNQWASVSDPFQTYALTGEMALHRNNSRISGTNIGLIAMKDVAGTLDYGTLSMRLTLAHYFSFNRQGTSILSLGAEAGYALSGFDPSHAEMTDPSEAFERQQVGYPTLGTGIAWFWQPQGEWQFKSGIAMRNINRPNISYLGLDDTRLEPLSSIYLRAEWQCWQSVSLLPTAMLQLQGKYREIVYGMDVKWYLDNISQHQVSLATGASHRHGDALVTHLTMEYDAFIFAFYYDANISSLTSASHTIGAFELGLVYRMASNRGVRSIKCPVF